MRKKTIYILNLMKHQFFLDSILATIAAIRMKVIELDFHYFIVLTMLFVVDLMLMCLH